MELLKTIAGIIGSLTVIGGFMLALYKMVKKLSTVVEGMKSLLRKDIMDIYYLHSDEEEPTLREYERKNLDALFAAYKAHGGNSFVSDLYNDEMRHWHVTR